MASITIKINMDNDAFVDNKWQEVNDILQKYLNRNISRECNLLDTNGNVCGSVEVEED